MQQTDVAIIGGGIIGLATAYRLLERFPGRKVTILEKEREVAQHQTGHNSGVLHSGIYYRPGSLRAINCREGKLAMEAFCQKENIPFNRCGKVIVAVTSDEIPQLERIFERGLANDIRCERIGPERLKEIEPHVVGVQAIHVPDAGIVDYRQVTERLAERFKEAGGELKTSAKVTGMFRHDQRMVVQNTAGELEARLVVNCGGLHSDRLAWLSGTRPEAQIIPFRGEYFELKPSAHHLCRALIYPVPDPDFPFLGVHFTRMIHGGVECGPNAVFAFAREGYYKTSFNLFDTLESVTYPGFLRMAWRHWHAGLNELYRSFNKAAFVAALQRLVPEVRDEHLVPAPAGVRAQALTRDGNLVDDFLILENDLVVNVCNAPSPAATASLNIGKLIVDKLAPRFE
ncbi:L-2-hydroxyglutarate oxidase [Schlesneria paludicola]|uniref:L-2-hydroxyglutarate oxidase n=1 Tax=Schlesneria paludicola TaxID=360056 RepID=UPI00029A6E8B|nr:L-2-hydroxyglutarate oxidase [Schlesneria paludicola]